MKTKKTGS